MYMYNMYVSMAASVCPLYYTMTTSMYMHVHVHLHLHITCSCMRIQFHTCTFMHMCCHGSCQLKRTKGPLTTSILGECAVCVCVRVCVCVCVLLLCSNKVMKLKGWSLIGIVLLKWPNQRVCFL